MKFLIINPPIREWAKPNAFPLGLGYIASIMLESGHCVEVLDINAQRYSPDQVEGLIINSEFDAVGIGAIVTVYGYVKWLAGMIKKYRPEIPIIAGGSVATSIPKILLEKTDVDIACIGEGEETIKELARALEDGTDLKKVRGIWFKDADGSITATEKRLPIKNLDKLPFPAWDLFPMDIYLENPIGALNLDKWKDGSGQHTTELSMNLIANRGCPYRCIYCYHDFLGHGFRSRSPESVISEIKHLNNKYGVTYVHFVDDEFVGRRRFVLEFCRQMREADLGITWGCSGRVNLMSEELIRSMVEAGCVLIGYGIESGSQKILDILKKGVTVDQAKHAVRLTQKYLGWADCSFMIGTPGETRETINETINFCKELNLAPEVIFFITPYPGTELYERALREGKIDDEEQYLLSLGEQGEQILINFTDFSNEELIKIQHDMIKELKAQNIQKHNSTGVIKS